jgi:ribulose-phosphate 3-epimerase
MLLSFFSKSLKKEIIPVINVKTKQKFEERLRQISKFSGIFQIDVADGDFTSWKNWNVPEELKTIKGIREKFELHLMVKNPERVLPLWLETRPKRIIIHQEALRDFDTVYQMCQKAKVELALALNPSTSLDPTRDYLKKINFVVFLSVAPGPSGQKFQWYVLDKVQDLRKKYPQLNIEVDGGINEETFSEVLKAGANYLAIGSAIFERENPKEKILVFQKMLYEKK